MKSLVSAPDRVLIKTSRTIVIGRERDAQMVVVPGAYILLGKPKVNIVFQATPAGLKKPLCVASAFSWKMCFN